MSNKKEELIKKMNEIIDKPAGKQAVWFILNSLGFLPYAGGLFAACGSIWSKKEQQKFNKYITKYATETNSDLKNVLKRLDDMLQNPTKAKMALLLGEIIGNDMTESFLSKAGNQIPLILNPQTVNEIKPFIDKGWVSISPTGSACLMGAGNRVGNHIEENKNPYGIGSGFVLKLEKSYFDN